MLRNFFRLSYRNLIHQKQTTLISILGLVIALSVILQIAGWCSFELSYDKFHSKANRIYRFTIEENRPEENFYWHFARCWQPWRNKLPDFYPEIESLTELRHVRNAVVKTPKHLFNSKNTFAVDSTVFHIFDFEFLKENPQTRNVGKTIVISESMAKKLFPDQDAMNRVVELYGDGLNGFEKHIITGIYRDLPPNSHFHADILIHCNKKIREGNDFAYTYILLKEGNIIEQIKKQNDKFIKTHAPENQQKSSTIHYTPITDIHLNSHIERELENNGDIKQVKLFVWIGLGILLIALINYLNLLLASFGKRNKYININIIIGAKQKHSLFLFFFESFNVALVVLIISILLFKPISYFLYSAGITSTTASFNGTVLIISLIFFFLVILSGILPVYVFKINTSKFLSKHSNNSFMHNKAAAINKPMLVLQFAISIIVIISSLMLMKQNKYAFSKNLGRDNSNIVMLSRNFWMEEPDIMRFKDELRKIPEVADVTMCMDTPGDLVKDARSVEDADIPYENKNQMITILPVDGNFFKFFNIPMVAGNAKEYYTGQQFENYILNEAAIKKLGFHSAREAIGTRFKINNYDNQSVIKGGTLVGVVKDFNFSSLYNPIEPTIFFSKPIWQWRYLVKLSPGDKNKNLAQVKQVWNKVFPDFPFDYQFLDDVYSGYYTRDIITGKLTGWFSVICIILSSIGLLGISSILIVKKTKEIGIRKVNGARVNEIMAMLNGNFTIWITLAFIVACPIAWYIINKWLQSFAYKTEMSWWVFAAAGAVAMALAVITVSWQSWRSATRNPVEALRYE